MSFFSEKWHYHQHWSHHDFIFQLNNYNSYKQYRMKYNLTAYMC